MTRRLGMAERRQGFERSDTIRQLCAAERKRRATMTFMRGWKRCYRRHYAIRGLWKNRGFSAIAVCMLAPWDRSEFGDLLDAGCGGAAPCYPTLIRPGVMVYEDEALSVLRRTLCVLANTSIGREQNHVFTEMAATRGRSVSITGDGAPNNFTAWP